jgi:hypothetical protein
MSLVRIKSQTELNSSVVMVLDMNKKELFEFCGKWLSEWTGNRPDALLKYYHDDALYIDPANRDGLKGHKEIRRYFERLLDVYHDWTWKPIEVFPIESGAIVKWECTIPLGQETIHEIGLDIVEIDGNKITRNEVYFDRTRLVAAVEKKRRDRRLINL